jgi:hypothetical protein
MIDIPPARQRGRAMPIVTDRFDVHMQPLPDGPAGAAIARHHLDKRYHGALDATGNGEMLSHRTATAGSAGYVAIERVSGTLDGRRGSFVLQHAGLMDRGAPQLDLQVIPDSADGELVGLRGRMQIRIEAGRHAYVFDYTLDAGEATG